LPRGFFGYQVKETDAWLDDFCGEHQFEVKETLMDIARLKAEKEYLDSRVSALANALNEAATRSPFVESGRASVEDEAQIILGDAKLKAQRALEQGMSQANIQRSKTMVLDDEIGVLRKKLTYWLSQIQSEMGSKLPYLQDQAGIAAGEKLAV
jgi:cell division septum initiation protein DivIVA